MKNKRRDKMAIRKWMLNWPAYKNKQAVARMKRVVKGKISSGGEIGRR